MKFLCQKGQGLIFVLTLITHFGKTIMYCYHAVICSFVFQKSDVDKSSRTPDPVRKQRRPPPRPPPPSFKRSSSADALDRNELTTNTVDDVEEADDLPPVPLERTTSISTSEPSIAKLIDVDSTPSEDDGSVSSTPEVREQSLFMTGVEAEEKMVG